MATDGENLRRSEDRLLVPVVLAIGIAAVLLGVLYPSPTQDTTCRYAMMAEKFAAGEWFEAFHPRFCVLFPALTGCVVRLFGTDGLTACVAAAMLGWALALVPLFRLVRNVFGSGVAWFAVVLAVICPKTLFWGFQGLRETWRLLAMLLVVSALFEPRKSEGRENSSFVQMMLGTLILLTLRVDTFLFAFLAVAAYAVHDVVRWRFAVLAVWALVWAQPCCYLTWVWTGWWLPSPQIVAVVVKCLGLR